MDHQPTDDRRRHRTCMNKRSHLRSNCFLPGVSAPRRGLNRRFYRKFILHKRTKATVAIASKIGEIAKLLRNRMNHDKRSNLIPSNFSRSAAPRPRYAGLQGRASRLPEVPRLESHAPWPCSLFRSRVVVARILMGFLDLAVLVPVLNRFSAQARQERIWAIPLGSDTRS